MKYAKRLISLLACSCALSAAAVNMPKLSVGDIVKFNDKSYMVVFNFNNYPKYEEFQRNTAIMQNANNAIIELSKRIESESDPTAKENMKLQLKQLRDEFDINDKTMQRGYNFSSNRNYMLMFLKTNICVPVSEEEFSQFKFKNGEKIDPLSIIKKDGARYARKNSVEGIQENQQFQQVLGFTLNCRAELAKLRKSLDNNSDLEQVSKISERIAELEKQLKQHEEQLFSKYGMRSGTSYMLEIEKSKLLMLLTPEDLAKIEAQKKIQNQSK